MSRAVLFWVALLFFVVGATFIVIGVRNAPQFTAGGTNKSVTKPAAYKPSQDKSKWLSEYELTERSERKIGTKELAGKLHLVSFFFVSCPASCRTQNQHFADLEREFGKEGVKFVAITCDPENDTPEKLREYANLFNAPEDTWYFLTGDLLYIRRVAAEVYGVALDRKSHVERFILVDETGKIRGHYPWAEAAKLAELKADLRKLLADKEAKTAGEIREEKQREERLKELEAEETADEE